MAETMNPSTPVVILQTAHHGGLGIAAAWDVWECQSTASTLIGRRRSVPGIVATTLL